MMCQCSFISCNKYATLMGDVHSGGVGVGWGAEGTWESLYFPLNFAVNLKSLKKKKNPNKIY